MNIRDYKRALMGISGVHVTAYDNEGAIDPQVTGKVIRRIADAGIHNIVCGGNTGEFYSLQHEEVLRLQAICVAAVDGRTAVTAAAGRSVGEAIATAKAARREGAQGVMVHHPLDPFAAPIRRRTISSPSRKHPNCRSSPMSGPMRSPSMISPASRPTRISPASSSPRLT